MNRVWAFMPLVVLAAIVAVGAFMLLRAPEREIISEGRIGRPAPELALATLDGGASFAARDYAERAYVVNLFASWCTPCRAEHPLLMQLKQEGVTIVGVAFKDEPDATRNFLRGLGDPYATVALDPDGRYGIELGAAGVPETFVVSADGQILAVYRGPLTPETIEGVIRPALNQNELGAR